MVQLYVRIMSALRSKSEEGAVATEYGVLISFIAIAVVAGALLVSGALNGFFGEVAEEIGTWDPSD
jgi:pilus assembly protein Flp/PilA